MDSSAESSLNVLWTIIENQETLKMILWVLFMQCDDIYFIVPVIENCSWNSRDTDSHRTWKPIKQSGKAFLLKLLLPKYRSSLF